MPEKWSGIEEVAVYLAASVCGTVLGQQRHPAGSGGRKAPQTGGTRHPFGQKDRA